MELECNCDHEPLPIRWLYPSSGRRDGSNAPRKRRWRVSSRLAAAELTRAKGMGLDRIINKAHLGTLSEERFRREQHQSPEVVRERDAPVELAPQDPVNH